MSESNITETPKSNREKIFEYQKDFYEKLAGGFDLFKKDEYEELKKAVGYAVFGPPTELNENETDATYTKKQQEKIDQIYQAILDYGSYDRLPGVIIMTTIFVFGEKLDSEDIFQVPIFRIRKCHKKIPEFEYYKQLRNAKIYGDYINNESNKNYCTIFIDDEARVYESWNHYLEYNNLPQCKMYVPSDGKYQLCVLDEANRKTEIMLDIKLSPACTYLQKATYAADIAGILGGFGSMAVFGAAAIPAITVGPAVLGGAAVIASVTGAYSAFRSMAGLYDRKVHRQTIGLENAEARGHWLGAAGGLAAGTSIGASRIISQTVSSGATVGNGARTFFNITTGANLFVNGSAVANSLYLFKTRYDNKESPSKLEIIQFTTSLLFFAHAAWNVRTANTFINETQNNVLSEYEASLSSNRKRKMFNKALLESERIRGTEAGRAEMIRGLRTITNHDEFFGTLVRNNKLFNENKARFTVSSDGRILVNTNMLIDSSEFASMSVTTKQNFFANLPENPVKTPNVVRTTNTLVRSSNAIQLGDELLDLVSTVGRFAMRNTDPNVQEIVNEVLNYFESDIREKLSFVINYFGNEINDLTNDIKRVFRYTDKILVIIQYLFQYLEDYMGIYGSNQNVGPNELLQSLFTNQDKINMFTFIIRSMDLVFIDEIIKSFREWVKDRVRTFWNSYEEMKHQISKSIQYDCPICKGVYYSGI